MKSHRSKDNFKKIIFVLLLIFLFGCAEKYEIVKILSRHDKEYNLDFECKPNSAGLKLCGYEYRGCVNAVEEFLCIDERKPPYRILCSDDYEEKINNICVRYTNSCLARFSINMREDDCRLINNSKEDLYFI